MMLKQRLEKVEFVFFYCETMGVNKLQFGSVHVMCLEVFGVDRVVDFWWDWD